MAIVTLTKQNFDSMIEKNEFVVIDFWADWCEPCHAFDPVYEQIANKYPEMLFTKVDVQQQPELVAEFTIRSVPTLMIFRQKIMVFCEAGLLPGNAVEDLLNQAKSLNMQEVRKQLLGVE